MTRRKLPPNLQIEIPGSERMQATGTAQLGRLRRFPTLVFEAMHDWIVRRDAVIGAFNAGSPERARRAYWEQEDEFRRNMTNAVRMLYHGDPPRDPEEWREHLRQVAQEAARIGARPPPPITPGVANDAATPPPALPTVDACELAAPMTCTTTDLRPR